MRLDTSNTNNRPCSLIKAVKIYVPTLSSESPPRQKAAHILASTSVCFFVVFLIAPLQFVDPFLHADDLAAHFWPADFYLNRGLSEGRWVAYLWTLTTRGADLHLLYFIFAVAWASTCAMFSAALFRSDHQPWRSILIAVALTLSPQTAAQTATFLTITPAIIVIFVYAYICLSKSEISQFASLLILTPAALMCYTSTPIVLLSMFLILNNRRIKFDYILLVCASFFLSVIISLFIIFNLNYYYFGKFGISADTWRTSRHSIDKNTPITERIYIFLKWTSSTTEWMLATYPSMIFVFFFASVTILIFRARDRAIALIVATACAIGSAAVISITTDLQSPYHSTVYFWLIVLGLLARLMTVEDSLAIYPRVASRALCVCAVTITIYTIFIGGLSWRSQYDVTLPFQRESRSISDRIHAQTNGDPNIDVFIFGDAIALKSGHAVADTTARGSPAIWLRDLLLRRSPVHPCFIDFEGSPARCEAISPIADDLEYYPAPGSIIRMDGMVIVNLPRINR